MAQDTNTNPDTNNGLKPDTQQNHAQLGTNPSTPTTGGTQTISSRKKALYGGLAVLAVLVLGSAGFFTWQRSNKKTDNNKDQTTNTQASAPNNADAAAVVASVRQELARQFIVHNSQPNQGQPPTSSGTIDVIADNGTGPPQPVTGYNFLVMPGNSPNLMILVFKPSSSQSATNSSDGSKADSVILSQLAHFNLSEVTDKSQQINTPTGSLTIYKNNTTVCDYTSSEAGGPYLRCADLKAYPSLAQEVQPFAQVYEKQSPDPSPAPPVTVSNMTMFGPPVIKDSQTPGYKIALMPIGAMKAAFFRAPDSDWQLLPLSPWSPDCSDLTAASHDAHLAYLGQVCINDRTGGQQTVK